MRQNLGQIGNQNSENKLFSPQMVLQKPRTQVKLYNCWALNKIQLLLGMVGIAGWTFCATDVCPELFFS